jgi:phage terminase large subunit GpA-like protein
MNEALEDAVNSVMYDLPEALRSALMPPARLGVSDWCDTHRMLSDKFSSEPGRWVTERVPYLREIMDSFADPNVGTIIFLKCARVGGTEFLNNILAYTADARPMPCMYVLPTEPDVKDEFAGRVKSIFEDSEKLREHTQDTGWATEHQITLNTCTIYGGWATSPGTLIRKTIGVAVFDEIDNCELAAGKLGNTWRLLLKRLETFGYRAKAVAVTTPTTENASGWKLYQASDRRKPYVPCPHCGHYQVMRFENLVFDSKKSPDEIELDKLADLRCTGCASLIHQDDQPWMVARVAWVPDSQTIATAYDFDGDDKQRPQLNGPAPRTRNRGYWINCLYSPWVSWSQAAAEFLRVKDDPDTLRVFKNAWLGEAWADRSESTTDEQLAPKIEAAKYPAGQVSPQAKLILVGADVQQHSLYFVAREFCESGMSRLVDYDQVESFEALYKRVAGLGYQVVGEPGQKMRSYAVAIDARYRTDEVFDWVSAYRGVVPVHGYLSRRKPVERVNIAARDAEPRWVWEIDTTRFKGRLANLIKSPLTIPNAWHLCSGVSDEYTKHITSEHYVYERSKKGVKRWAWRPKTEGRPNHWWDCEVYIQALAEILAERGELNVRALAAQTPRKGMAAVTVPQANHPQALRPSSQRTRIRTPWDK